MSHRIVRSLAAPLAVALIAPLAASAQTQVFFTQAKVVRKASPSAPVAGTGKVTVQVLVNANGSVGTTKIEKSTNPADNAAALDVARHSTYKPAFRDGKAVLSFYTMDLKFSGTSMVNDTGTSSNDVLQANALVRAAKYAEAKAMLQSYLGSHPGDAKAQALLGVTETFMKDPIAAANAFEAAGTVPEQFKNVALQAYNDAAETSLGQKNWDAAAGYSTKSLDITKTATALYTRGIAETSAQQYPKGIADIEAARDLAPSEHASAETMVAIQTQLAEAYFLGGEPDKGLIAVQAVRAKDPAAAAKIEPAVGNYYAGKAQAVSKTDPAAAVTDYEDGAKAAPSQAPQLYLAAAVVLANNAKTPADWKTTNVEAGKVLASDPNNPTANYISGVALSSTGDKAGATAALQKAKANVGSNAQLSGQIDKALSQLK